MWDFKVYSDMQSLLADQPKHRQRSVNLLVVHYTAVTPPKGTVSEILGQIRAIDAYHREHNGWKGIGYHIAIHPSGAVASCRPLHISGAHANGYNNHSVGIVMMADENTFTQNPRVLLPSLHHVLSALCKTYNIPTTSVKLHRQLNKTKCPPIPQKWVDVLHNWGYTSISLGGDK